MKASRDFLRDFLKVRITEKNAMEIAERAAETRDMVEDMYIHMPGMHKTEHVLQLLNYIVSGDKGAWENGE